MTIRYIFLRVEVSIPLLQSYMNEANTQSRNIKKSFRLLSIRIPGKTAFANGVH